MLKITGIVAVAALLEHHRISPSGLDGNPGPDQIGRQFWQPVIFALSPPEIDAEVVPFDATGLTQALAERCDLKSRACWRCWMKESNHR